MHSPVGKKKAKNYDGDSADAIVNFKEKAIYVITKRKWNTS